MPQGSAACLRCHARKQKCSKDHPCRNCIDSSSRCEYRRKPRTIKISDVEYAQLTGDNIQLRQEIAQFRKLVGNHMEKIDDGDQEFQPLQLLASASGEVICSQLQIWANGEEDEIKGFTYSLEEVCYDWVLESSLHPPRFNYEDVEEGYGIVTIFIKSGYLTIEPDFLEKCRHHFSTNEGTAAFSLKMMMVIALGKVYHKNMNAKNMCTIPGVEYFSYVIRQCQMSALAAPTTDTVELLGTIAIYLRLIDKKIAAYTMTNTAISIATSFDLHRSQNDRDLTIWWSIYCLNRFLAVRIGKPVTKVDGCNSQVPTQSLQVQVLLAKISDSMTENLFGKSNIDRRRHDNYKSISSTIHSLISWYQSLPEAVKLEVDDNQQIESTRERLVYNTNLNYLHHLYLASIPILMKFAQVQITTFNRGGKLVSASTIMTRPMLNLVTKLIDGCQLTLNIFLNVYHGDSSRLFGFTDIDYILATNLTFLIAMVLRIPSRHSFINSLQTGLKLMNRFAVGGNLVWQGKLTSLVGLITTLAPILKAQGYAAFVDNQQQWTAELESVLPELDNNLGLLIFEDLASLEEMWQL